MLKRENNTSLSIKDNENNQRFVQAEPTLKKDGIGIENFLQGKVILITGATGFLTKVLVEKILRSMSDVSKIYLIIRGKNKEDAKQRLKKEIVDIELFKCIKQKYGEQYEEFMWSKLVGVVGNIGQSDLGMEQDLATEIARDVQIIANGAADTKFDQRYDVALQVNAMGPCNLMEFAKKCRNLELFLHLSTSTVKRNSRKEILMEEKECLSLRDGGGSQTSIMTEAMVLENEMKLVSYYKKFVKHNGLTPKMKQLSSIRYKIPVDMVVNGILGVIAKHVSMDKKVDMSIYHLSSTTSNPLVLEDFLKIVYQHFKSRPYFSPSGRPVQVSEMKFFNSLSDFSAYLWTSSEAAQFSSKKMFEFIKFKEYAENLATIYFPYAFHTDWLDDTKTRGLIGSMSEEEKKKFGCDAKSIKWKDYIVNVHIPGFRRHIWKEKGLSKLFK